MTSIRANHLFAILMSAAFVTAFFVPHRVSDRGRAHVQALFAPVSLPARWMVATAHDIVWPPGARDDAFPDQPRELASVYQENEKLRVEQANLQGQLEHYRSLAAEYERLGPIGLACTRYAVMGADSGSRDSLSIVGATIGRLKAGMPVLTPSGLIGKVDRAGLNGAQVLLLTDRQSIVTGSFGRFDDDVEGKLVFRSFIANPVLIQGVGGRMRCELMEWKDVTAAGMQPGDWCVIDDGAWPAALKWRRIGRVESIQQSRKNILFAEIVIAPVVDGKQLSDVMVMDK